MEVRQMSDSHQRRLGAGLLAGFLYLAYCVMRQAVWLQQLDTTVSHLMSRAVTPSNTIVLNAIAFLGSPVVVIALTCILCVWLWVRNSAITSLWIGGLQFLGSVITELAKQIVARPRPLHQLIPDSGFSFPSGHTFCTALFVFSILALVLPTIKKRHCRVAAILAGAIWIGFVAFSRFYFRDHFASDVLASILLASGYWLVITPYEGAIKKLLRHILPERIQ